MYVRTHRVHRVWGRVISGYGGHARRLRDRRRGLKNDRARHGIRHGLKINRNAKSNLRERGRRHVSRLLLRDISWLRVPSFFPFLFLFYFFLFLFYFYFLLRYRRLSARSFRGYVTTHHTHTHTFKYTYYTIYATCICTNVYIYKNIYR